MKVSVQLVTFLRVKFHVSERITYSLFVLSVNFQAFVITINDNKQVCEIYQIQKRDEEKEKEQGLSQEYCYFQFFVKENKAKRVNDFGLWDESKTFFINPIAFSIIAANEEIVFGN